MTDKDKKIMKPREEKNYQDVDCSTLETEEERIACKLAQDKHKAKGVNPTVKQRQEKSK